MYIIVFFILTKKKSKNLHISLKQIAINTIIQALLKHTVEKNIKFLIFA